MRSSHRLSFVWLIPAVLAACSEGPVTGSGGGLGSPDGGGGAGGAGGATASGGTDAGRPLPDGGVAPGHAFGEACTSDASGRCRAGLTCTSGKCDFSHSASAGAPCVAADECQQGLQCVAGQCAPAGQGALDAACKADTDCQSGLRCGIVGFGLQCVAEGTSDVGQACVISGDCFAGLVCAPAPALAADASASGSTCAPIPPPVPGKPPPVPFGVPVAPALACDPASQGTVDAYFEVPGASGTLAGGDFFRLPFPNDARIHDGKIDLSGFPTPGSSLLGFDPVQIYLDAITANETAWGAYPSTIFRFSGPINFDSLNPIQYVDITDPTQPEIDGATWSYDPNDGKYVCHDWLAVQRPKGVPLKPGHVYTVYLSTAGRDQNGLSIKRSPQLAALLGATAPSDAGLANAYAAFKPLRDYLSAQSIATDTVLNATVFTAGQVRAPMEKLAAATLAAPPPTAASWVKCGGGAVSPCPQADGNRACGSGAADYDEYHALVSIPIFQKGTPPYLTAGGDIDAAPVRTEQVCAALTVPKGATMPAGGFPLAVFAHGTGGSFRDHVRDEVAGALARATPPMAVLGYDQVQHGPRRGTSTASPNTLFFNFANPMAARGNPMQGAADVISMGRLSATLAVPASVTGGADIKFDPAKVVFFGHSQGSMHGSLGLPYTDAYKAALLSGNGALLMDALLTKTSPQNIAAAVPFVLGGDYDAKLHLNGGENHPVLTILQQWIDPADPMNFGGVIARSPNTGIAAKSVFQTYGIGDTYSPAATLQNYALAAGLKLATHDPSVTTPDAIGDPALAEQPVPLSGNFAPSGGPTVTLAVREYQNAAGKDGHFVVFDVPSANQDAVRFLSMAASGQVPQVGK